MSAFAISPSLFQAAPTLVHPPDTMSASLKDDFQSYIFEAAENFLPPVPDMFFTLQSSFSFIMRASDGLHSALSLDFPYGVEKALHFIQKVSPQDLPVLQQPFRIACISLSKIFTQKSRTQGCIADEI